MERAPANRRTPAGRRAHTRRKHGASSLAFGRQFGERREILIALDQRGARPNASYQVLIERPDLGAYRSAVRIDEQ
jgi:hypothetical protein